MTFLLLFIYFFPTKLYSLYFLGISLSLIMIFIKKGTLTIYKSSPFLLILFFIAVIFSGISIGNIIYNFPDPFRGYTELFRWIPIALFLCFWPYLKISDKQIIFFLKLFTIVNFTISLLQYIGLNDYIYPLTRLYNADNHVEISLKISSRALGLQTGPGDNGAISVIIYTIFLTSYLNGLSGKNSIFYSLLSLLVIVFSQSQTAFIVAIGITLYNFFFYFIYFEKSRKKILALFIISLLFITSFIYIFLDKVRYLATLFNYGLERSSYVKREIKSIRILKEFFDNNILNIFFGNSKEYYADSTAMDNEYIFILTIYGIIGFIIYISIISFFICAPYLKKTYRYNQFFLILSSIFVAGAVLAWPAAFILDPKILFTIIIFFVICKKSLYEKTKC